MASTMYTIGWKVGRNGKNTLEKRLPTSEKRLEGGWKVGRKEQKFFQPQKRLEDRLEGWKNSIYTG